MCMPLIEKRLNFVFLLEEIQAIRRMSAMCYMLRPFFEGAPMNGMTVCEHFWSACEHSWRIHKIESE